MCQKLFALLLVVTLIERFESIAIYYIINSMAITANQSILIAWKTQSSDNLTSYYYTLNTCHALRSVRCDNPSVSSLNMCVSIQKHSIIYGKRFYNFAYYQVDKLKLYANFKSAGKHK